MTKLLRTASLGLIVAIVALLLVTINATGEQPTLAGRLVEATPTMPAIPTLPDTPPGPPPATPVGQAFAPIVYDTLSTPTLSPSPSSTHQVELTRTMPAPPP